MQIPTLLSPLSIPWFPLEENLGMQARQSWRVLQKVPNSDQGPQQGTNSLAGKLSPTCTLTEFP